MALRDLLATLFAPAAEQRLARLMTQASELVTQLTDVSDKLTLAIARQAKREVRAAAKAVDAQLGDAPTAPARLAPTHPTARAQWKADVRKRLQGGASPLAQGPPEAQGAPDGA